MLFAVRAMGGGDVKLLTALALWIAPLQFLNLLIVMALVGGVLTMVLGAWHVMRAPARTAGGALRRRHRHRGPVGARDELPTSPRARSCGVNLILTIPAERCGTLKVHLRAIDGA